MSVVSTSDINVPNILHPSVLTCDDLASELGKFKAYFLQKTQSSQPITRDDFHYFWDYILGLAERFISIDNGGISCSATSSIIMNHVSFVAKNLRLKDVLTDLSGDRCSAVKIMLRITYIANKIILLSEKELRFMISCFYSNGSEVIPRELVVNLELRNMMRYLYFKRDVIMSEIYGLESLTLISNGFTNSNVQFAEIKMNQLYAVKRTSNYEHRYYSVENSSTEECEDLKVNLLTFGEWNVINGIRFSNGLSALEAIIEHRKYCRKVPFWEDEHFKNFNGICNSVITEFAEYRNKRGRLSPWLSHFLLHFYYEFFYSIVLAAGVDNDIHESTVEPIEGHMKKLNIILGTLYLSEVLEQAANQHTLCILWNLKHEAKRLLTFRLFSSFQPLVRIINKIEFLYEILIHKLNIPLLKTNVILGETIDGLSDNLSEDSSVERFH